MKITLERDYRKEHYTVGNLYIDGKYFCDTLEPADRLYNGGVLIPHETAIPCGTYSINMNVVSPRLSQRSFYQEVCKGKVPRLMNVPKFTGILIHVGNTQKDTKGCILVGENSVKGRVVNSRVTFRKLYAVMAAANERGEDITIEIK